MIDKVIKCNICGEGKGALVKEGVFGNPAQNIYECASCGHLYLAPLFSDEEERRFYADNYPAFLLERGNASSASPEKHFADNIKEAKRRFSLIDEVLAKDGSILEIGSATGFFLDYIKPYVKEVCGIEPNIRHREYAIKKGLPTYETLDNIPEKKFDVIFLYYVLEHIKDPIAFMKGLKGRLKNKRSRIVLEVPNAREALVSFYRCKAYNDFVWQRAHCSYFSVKSLKRLFDSLDMPVRFIPAQRYDFSNHMHWLIEGKPGGAGKYSHIFSDRLNEEYADSLKKVWLCDTILAITE